MTDNNLDEIQICQNVEPHSLGNCIKSQAIIKFAAVEAPAKFIRLQCNTDLNMPPANWLTNSASTYGLHQALYHSSGFASFHMAHMFPDCLGEVDVISDAENIKKLLKLPYAQKSTISMIVHKVGKTLLIDEFDFQKYLLRQASEDWKWIQSFFLENILSCVSEQDRNFCLKDKSRTALQRKNLLSKFLYHSLHPNSECKGQTDTPTDNETTETKTLPLIGSILPEANIQENVPDPKSNHVFNRNVVWTFEDIRMLIGTDMPIFGGGTRPCISLRLRDMSKPINVLTGIDYWLDNLMCNVPEVVMCYHIDGIVQKYELIKTEDLPYLEDSQFSPQLIRNVAQNILAFLKANATKAGHTYWLFKGKNDDVVKLYDLTTLCKNGNGNPKCDNPFTVPVAMLLYNLARNMKNSSEKLSAKKAGSIKTLLDNCIQLLPKEKYPQIITSSHYILSDLHIPVGIDPTAPIFDNSSDADSDTQSVYDDDLSSDGESHSEGTYDANISDEISETVVVQNICDTLREFNNEDNGKCDKPPSPLVASIEERCKIALQHICSGINCLQYFENNEEEIKKEEKEREREAERRRIIHEELHPNMAKPFQPIPLPYETLKPEAKMTNVNVPIPMGWDEKFSKGKKSQKLRKARGSSFDETSTVTVENNSTDNLLVKKSQLVHSWSDHLKVLLFEKACLIYATFAEQNYTSENYGKCLQCIYMMCRCQQVVTLYGTTATRNSVLLGRAGDCFFQFSKKFENIDLYLEQFENYGEVEKLILAHLDKEFGKVTLGQLPLPTKNIEQLMVASCTCYEAALKSSDQKGRNEMLRRMGSVRNELGVKYMYWAQEEYNKFTKKEDEKETENPEESSTKKSTKETECKDQSKEDSSDAVDKKEAETKEPLYQTLAKLSYDNLIKGIAAFEEVNDNVNLSFLLCNMGRFMRFRAHIPMQGEDSDDVRMQKKFYIQSFTYYQRALCILGSRKENPDLWDLVNWELSTATFTLAKQVQDYSNNELSSEEVEREIVDLLQKSLKLCDIEHAGPRQVLYTYRSGLVHCRLASFYHSQLLKSSDDHTNKTNLQLCRLHYEKASKILENLKELNDYLEVQLKRIGLQEHLTEVTSSTNQKIKSLQTALEICIQTKPIFDYIFSNDLENVPIEEIKKYMKLFESRLQFILRTIAKLCLTKAGSGKDFKKFANAYKLMYSATLNVNHITNERLFAEHLSKVLEKIIEIDRSK